MDDPWGKEMGVAERGAFRLLPFLKQTVRNETPITCHFFCWGHTLPQISVPVHFDLITNNIHNT